MHSHHHGSSCGCTAHRVEREAGRGARLAALLPVLACAVCPACLSLYAKVLATLGVGFALTESQHQGILAVAVTASLLVSAARSWRSGRLWPVAVAGLGCALLVLGHALGDARWLEWSGVLVLLIGGIREQRVARRAAERAPEPALGHGANGA